VSYKIWKVIDSRFLEDVSQAKEHLICDIDKTYLETPFESLIKFAQIPFEKARAKITVSGAKEVLQAYRNSASSEAGVHKPLHFVSASPPQLRKVLSEKFRWDGLTWSSDTYKDQTYNLLKGRFSQFKHQVAYKSAAILNLLLHYKSGSHLHMIGDNAESDPVIYLGMKLFIEGRLSRKAYVQYLRIFDVPRLESLQLLRHTKIAPMQVSSVLIRCLDNSKYPTQEPLTDPILYFHNFFETALYFLTKGSIDLRYLSSLSRTFHSYYGISTPQMLRYLELFSTASPSPEVQTECKKIIETLNSEDMFPKQVKSLYLKEKNLEAYHKLTEEEILTLAMEWKEKIRKRKRDKN
jgi:hypothetical protein